MLSFDVHIPLSPDRTPMGLGARVFDAVSRMLQGVTHRTHDRPTDIDSSEPLTNFRSLHFRPRRLSWPTRPFFLEPDRLKQNRLETIRL